MMHFLSETNVLNHLDLSGMAFDSKSLILLAKNLSRSSSLLAVHLNDNGIVSSSDQELMMEILDIFGLSDLDLHEACRVKPGAIGDEDLGEKTVESSLNDARTCPLC